MSTCFSVSLGCLFLQQVLSSSHSHYSEKDSSLQFIALQGNKGGREGEREREMLHLSLKSDLTLLYLGSYSKREWGRWTNLCF